MSKRGIVFAKITSRDPGKRAEATGASTQGRASGVVGCLRRADKSNSKGPEHQGDGQRRTPSQRQGPAQVSTIHEILLTDEQWLNLIDRLPKEYDNIDWGVSATVRQQTTYFMVPIGTYFSILGILDADAQGLKG